MQPAGFKKISTNQTATVGTAMLPWMAAGSSATLALHCQQLNEALP